MQTTNTNLPPILQGQNIFSRMLRRFLQAAAPNEPEITLTFEQIEQILGEALPYTARHSKSSWWSNELRPSTRFQASSWLDAGWEVEEVNRDQEWVCFRRSLGHSDRGASGAEVE